MTGLLASVWFWLACAAGGVCVLMAGLFPPPRESRVRSLLDFALRVGGPVLPLIAVVLLAPGLQAETKGLLAPALLGAAGWLVTYLQNLDARDRDQIDMMQALRAEVGVILRAQQGRDPQDFARRLDAEIEAAVARGVDYQPFFPMPSTPVVFDALSDRVERLPSEVVERVIQFYTLLADLRRLAEDLRTDAFLRLPLARRRNAHAHYFQMLGTLRALATATIYEINVEMGLNDPSRGLDSAILAAAGETPSRRGQDLFRPESAPDASVGTP